MILKVKYSDADKAIELLRGQGIEVDTTYSTFEAFLDDEIDQCRESMIYDNEIQLGENTLEEIADEVKTALMNDEISFVSEIYSEIYNEYEMCYKMSTMGVYTISNNISVELKNLVDDTFCCVVGNEVYIGDMVIDSEDNSCVEIGEMLIPLNEFMRV